MKKRHWGQALLWIVASVCALAGAYMVVPIKPAYLIGLPSDLGDVVREFGTTVTVDVFNPSLNVIAVAPPIFGCGSPEKKFFGVSPLSKKTVNIHVDVSNKPYGRQTVGVLLPIKRNGKEETVLFPVKMNVVKDGI